MSGEDPSFNASVTSSNSGAAPTDSIVLEEEIDPNYVPSEDEILEYAKWLGMDLKKDRDLFWVAKEGLMAPLPKNWKPCKTKDTEDIYYFNFQTGESTWDHPCDGYYKRLFEEEKKKKETTAKESNDQNRTQAKADVEKLLGKSDKKKKKKVRESEAEALSATLGSNKSGGPSSIGSTANTANSKNSGALSLGPLPGIGGSGLEHKPLPGISSMGMLRASSNPNAKSDISLLTTSDGSGASIRDANTNNHNTETTKRSKMSMRLSTVVAISDTNQLDVTPKKAKTSASSAASSSVVGMGALDSDRELGGASLTAEAKRNTDTVTGAVDNKASTSSLSLSSSSTTSALPVTVTSAHSQGNRDRDRSSSSHITTSQPQIVAEAKPTSSSSDSMGGASSRREESSSSPSTAALRNTIHEMERELDTVHLELADAERRVSRAHQRQGVAEETETTLRQQLSEAKEQYKLLESLNDELGTENKDLRVSMQRIREEPPVQDNSSATGTGDDSSATAISAAQLNSLREELRATESSERRAVEMHKSLRDELNSQTAYYEGKMRSHDLSMSALKEDLAHLQKSFDASKAAGESTSQSQADALTASAATTATLQLEVTALTEKLAKSEASISVAEAKAAAATLAASVASSVDSAAPDAQTQSQLLEARQALVKSTIDLAAARDETEDARARCKRYEQLAVSWETDCTDKNTRLVAARKSLVDMEEQLHTAEREAVAAANKQKLLNMQIETESSELAALQKTHTVTLGELRTLKATTSELEGQLQAVVALNAASQKKADTLQLALDQTKVGSGDALQSALFSTVTSASGDASAAVLTAQIDQYKQAVKDHEAQLHALQSEVESHKQVAKTQTDAAISLQNQLDSITESTKSAVQAQARMQANADAERDSASQQTELELRKLIQQAISERDLAAFKAERIAGEVELLHGKTAVLEQEVTDLQVSLEDKSSLVVSLKADIRKHVQAAAAATAVSATSVTSTAIASSSADVDSSTSTAAQVQLRAREMELIQVQTQLAAQSSRCGELEESLLRANRELFGKASELSASLISLETERYARQSLEADLAQSREQVSQLRRDHNHARMGVNNSSSANAAPVVSQTNYTASASGNNSIIDLSMKLGQQSSAISALERKLLEATETIQKMNARSASSSSSHTTSAPAYAHVDDREGQVLGTSNAEEGDLDKSMLIREMMIEFLQRKKPLTRDTVSSDDEEAEQNKGRGQEQSSAGGKNNKDKDTKMYWQSVLLKETKFVADARRVLAEEKAAIRTEQQQLLQRRSSWKNHKQSRSPGVQQILNQQTIQLNAAIEHSRRTTEWLQDRERKIGSLQQLVEGESSAAANVQIKNLAGELDADSLDLGMGYQALQLGAHQLSLLKQMDQSKFTGFFPQTVALSSKSRNAYLDFQTENARPLYRPSGISNQQQQQQALGEKQEHRRAAKDVQQLAQERAQVRGAYDEHIGWLASLQRDISTYQTQSLTQAHAQQRQVGKGGKGQAFVAPVPVDKFEL